MKRLVLAISAGALLLSGAPAWADGYGHKRHGYREGRGYDRHYEKRRDYGRRERHSRRRGNDDGAIIVGALVGGLVLGHLLSQPAYSAPTYPSRASYAPQRPVLGNCRATVGTGYYGGYPAQFGGTMCFDGYGRGYITPGSEYFIGYLR